MRQQVGSRQEVFYFLTDHLGSPTVIIPASGPAAQLRYAPWGTLRSGTSSTPYQFTGQRSEASLGIQFFNARWYDSQLGRFLSADTIIPQPGNPLAWDRYAYVNNSPINATDPTGHASTPAEWSEPEDCMLFSCVYNVVFAGNWTYQNMLAAIAAVKAVGSKFAEEIGGTASSAFNAVFQNRVTLAWVSSYTDSNGNVYTGGAITKSSTRIEIASLTQPGEYRSEDVAFVDARNNIVHEFGHAFAQLWYGADGVYDQSGPYGTFASIPSDYLSNDGFYPSPVEAPRTWRQHPCFAGDSVCPNETFADQFLGWTFGKWDDDRAGVGDWRNNYMTVNMAEWTPAATRR